MQTTIEILNKPVSIEWTKAAEAAMASALEPLRAEMELYFSCLIRKKVRFNDKAHSREFVPVNQHLAIAFRPVMTKACKIDRDDQEAPLADFQIKNPAAFVPRWLKIDYRRGAWEGEFGYMSHE